METAFLTLTHAVFRDSKAGQEEQEGRGQDLISSNQEEHRLQARGSKPSAVKHKECVEHDACPLPAMREEQPGVTHTEHCRRQSKHMAQTTKGGKHNPSTNKTNVAEEEGC